MSLQERELNTQINTLGFALLKMKTVYPLKYIVSGKEQCYKVHENV